MQKCVKFNMEYYMFYVKIRENLIQISIWTSLFLQT
jgi:hypothetical protein